MEIGTVMQLDEWMTANCYNKESYAIANRIIAEGYGLEKTGNSFVWYYTERGSKDYLNLFDTEREAVEFAYKKISADRFAKSHIVGFIKNQSQEAELVAELDKRGVEYWKDNIPFGGPDDKRTRVFVVGCSIKKTIDLREKFYLPY